VSGGVMYWTEAAPGEFAVYRANLDGTGMAGVVVRTGGEPSGIAVDPTGGKIYWTERGPGLIKRANTDGSDEQIILSSGIVDPVRIVLDTSSGHIYWTEASPADFMIFRADLDGANVDLHVPGLASPSGIDLDPESMPVSATKTTWGRIRSLY